MRRFLCLTALASPLLLDQHKAADKRHAICILYPNQSKTRGLVSFSQKSAEEPVDIVCSIKGLNPNGRHGIHIHEFGDLSKGIATAGAHYNPHNKTHGSPFGQQRHVGDLGNIQADPFGSAYMCYTDKLISLFGQNSVLGRSVVVHAKQDDLGRTNHPQSQQTGNSGSAMASGVIGLCKDFKTVAPFPA